uniref:Uncharacterized protein n=1 Tax=Eutreptiella gymnastica TaxID=73025 RepID=A0A7S4CC41_9EUGL
MNIFPQRVILQLQTLSGLPQCLVVLSPGTKLTLFYLHQHRCNIVHVLHFQANTQPCFIHFQVPLVRPLMRLHQPPQIHWGTLCLALVPLEFQQWIPVDLGSLFCGLKTLDLSP